MLQTVRKTIDELPAESFDEFYQRYVVSVQDKILENNISRVSATAVSLSDTTQLIIGINELTEELKRI